MLFKGTIISKCLLIEPVLFGIKHYTRYFRLFNCVLINLRNRLWQPCAATSF